MLQISGLGVTTDYASCLSYYQDAVFCAREYGAPPENYTKPVQNEAVPVDPSFWMLARRIVSHDAACSACNPNTQWCDDQSRCIPFTAQEMAAWGAAVGTAAEKPAGKVASSAKPEILIMGFSPKMIAIAGALGLAGWLLYKRRA